MRLFSEAVADQTGELVAQPYLHVRNGITPDFLLYVRSVLSGARAAVELESAQVPGKKTQLLFPFPDSESVADFRARVAAIYGVSANRVTISERHIKIYTRDAPAFPPPHKDRAASHLSVGVPISVTPASRLVLLPHLDRTRNLSTSAAYLRDFDIAAGLEDGSGAVILDTRPGDCVIFFGSEVYHERVHAAGSKILYLKSNVDGLDPLRENQFGSAQLRQVRS